ncbi:hypothetical protein T310_2394 [Rasamsonia emersonii CBS 393.64]|uniref:Uncharacterized protein n=1 Tax=Rasamsonia emersonii (strain ATCC 16479 / CBS 393.64 / IMI 116815) TaxID=1408163 RepID=A0A0F4YZL3_RASE3|nr:hypothetical protein T310_2394 [Rasamsonia emersonii CBS 393.64]KKA23555.1 hypothetical protein T310_2394 [Rasamsonia emersonii CBS 393.64]
MINHPTSTVINDRIRQYQPAEEQLTGNATPHQSWFHTDSSQAGRNYLTLARIHPFSSRHTVNLVNSQVIHNISTISVHRMQKLIWSKGTKAGKEASESRDLHACILINI